MKSRPSYKMAVKQLLQQVMFDCARLAVSHHQQSVVTFVATCSYLQYQVSQANISQKGFVKLLSLLSSSSLLSTNQMTCIHSVRKEVDIVEGWHMLSLVMTMARPPLISVRWHSARRPCNTFCSTAAMTSSIAIAAAEMCVIIIRVVIV